MKSRFKLLLLMLLTGLHVSSYSQQNTRTITGSVESAYTQQSLKGVSVLLKGTNSGVQTNENSNFSINANSGDILVVSSIGYATQEITVGSENRLTISLSLSYLTLDDLVVVGYGTQKKVNLTGAVSSISASQIKDRPITSGSQLLQGV